MQCTIDSMVHQGEHPITTSLHAEAAVSHPDEVHALMVAVLKGLPFGNGTGQNMVRPNLMAMQHA